MNVTFFRPPLLDGTAILRQAYRLSRLRWLTLLFTLVLWTLGVRLGVAPHLALAQLRLIAMVALLNLPLSFAYRWAQEGRLTLRHGLLLTYLHTLSDLIFLIGAIHYTGGLNSPGDVLLVVYLAAVAMAYPSQAVVIFAGVSVTLYLGLGVSYILGWLPLYQMDGVVLPLPPLRTTVLKMGADVVFILLISSIVWALSREQRQARAEAERDREYLERLYQLVQAGLRQQQVRALARYLADHMGELVDADVVYLTLWDEERNLPIPLAASGEEGERYRQIRVMPSDRPNLTETVRRLGRAVVVPDVTRSPYIHPDIVARFSVRAFIAVPMYYHHGGRFLGAAIFAYRQAVDLTPAFLYRAERATELLSLVLSRALVERRLREERHRLEQLLHLVARLNRMRDVHEMAREAVRGALDLLDADKGACYFLDTHRERLLNFYSHGLSDTYLAWVAERYRTLPGTQAVVPGGLVLVQDVEEQPGLEAVRPWARREGYRAYAVASLSVHGRLGGALTLYWAQPQRFLPEEVLILRLLASHLGVALENARLFQRLETEATTDPLTGLPNRRAFEQALAQEMARSRRYRRTFSLLMVDLDGFKTINDTYGHPVGDRVLTQMAAVFHRTLRTTDFVARYGGDEFIVLLPETGAHQARWVAEKLRRAVEEHAWIALPQGIRLSLSVGVATFPDDGEEAEELLTLADQRLYATKPSRTGQRSGNPAKETSEQEEPPAASC